jgi:hypothetical protein
MGAVRPPYLGWEVMVRGAASRTSAGPRWPGAGHRRRRAGWAVLLALVAAGLAACSRPGSPPPSAAPPLPGSCQPGSPRTLDLPSTVGLNYGEPNTVNGDWVGTSWLRPGVWPQVRPRLQQDLDFIVSHHLGEVQRIFIGLDQLMVWNRSTGFVRFDPVALRNFQEALDMFQAHHVKVIAVIFDQEVRSSPGNFHFEALDGRHPAMRAGYLRALDQFLRRFGSSPVVAAWDLFNEAYNSLGREGGLPRPPAEDPVSPNYSDAVVHDWIRDLYRTARCAAPQAWFTVSDTTELYWKNPPDTSLYQGAVDFYDIHVYASHPSPPDWAHDLHKPYLLGEVGADYPTDFENPTLNAQVVQWWVSHAPALGVKAVLAHDASGSIYSLRTGTLTPTGRVIAEAA